MRNDLAGVYSNRGNADADRGDLDAAIADYGAAIELREALRSDLGALWPPEMQNGLATAYMNLGAANSRGSGLSKAIAEFERAIAILRPLLEVHPDIQEWRSHLAGAEQNLALALQLAAKDSSK